MSWNAVPSSARMPAWSGSGPRADGWTRFDLVDGSSIHADVVVANADASVLYRQLLEPPRTRRPGCGFAQRFRAAAGRARANAGPRPPQRALRRQRVRRGVRRRLRPARAAGDRSGGLHQRARRPGDTPRRARGVVRPGERPAARPRRRPRGTRLGQRGPLVRLRRAGAVAARRSRAACARADRVQPHAHPGGPAAAHRCPRRGHLRRCAARPAGEHAPPAATPRVCTGSSSSAARLIPAAACRSSRSRRGSPPS